MNGYFLVCLFFSRTIFNSRPAGLLSYTNGDQSREEGRLKGAGVLRREWEEVKSCGDLL